MKGAALIWLLAAGLLCGDDIASGLQVTRVMARLNGVVSPRGFFNITVRLYQLPGADAAKFDLKQSRITVDFKPGATITREEMRDVIAAAGYKPGRIDIQTLSLEEASETGPGWVKIKRPTSKNPVIRWFQLNF